MAITINLAQTAFAPGDTISGNIEWDFKTGKVPKKIKIMLCWETQGKGKLDTESFGEIEHNAVSTTGNLAFTFKPPLFPWSFQGKNLDIIWKVVAQADNKPISNIVIIYAPNKEPIRMAG